jgi:hypothetical protein
LPPDPRGGPSDKEYIAHLEFFNEEKQRRIVQLERERMALKHGKLLALIGLLLNGYFWIPLRIIRWSEREREYEP